MDDTESKIPKPPDIPEIADLDHDDISVEDRLGAGGEADVYRGTVEQGGIRHTIAVKKPRFEGTLHKDVLDQFQSEAKTWFELSDHDNIVTVFGWNSSPLPWLGMEYMDGGTLDETLESLDLRESLWIASTVAEGVYYGHRHGVAHLDLKPGNILFREAEDGAWPYPKIADWGLAKLLLEHSSSVEGMSPTYAAPEQFDSNEYGRADDLTDIYQLGAVTYTMVVGAPPFRGTPSEIMRQVLQEDPVPPSEIENDVPGEVDEVLLKALEKDKSDRYDGILIFRDALKRLFDNISDHSSASRTSSEKSSSRSPGPLHHTNRSEENDSDDTEGKSVTELIFEEFDLW